MSGLPVQVIDYILSMDSDIYALCFFSEFQILSQPLFQQTGHRILHIDRQIACLHQHKIPNQTPSSSISIHKRMDTVVPLPIRHTRHTCHASSDISNDRPSRTSERQEIGLKNRLFPRSRNCGRIKRKQAKVDIRER